MLMGKGLFFIVSKMGIRVSFSTTTISIKHDVYSKDGTQYDEQKDNPAYTLREVVEDPNPMPELKAG